MLISDVVSTRLWSAASPWLGDVPNSVSSQFLSGQTDGVLHQSTLQKPEWLAPAGRRALPTMRPERSRGEVVRTSGRREQAKSAKTAVEVFSRVGLHSDLASNSQDVRIETHWLNSSDRTGRFARMRSRTGNSLSTLMFMVPLLGVPLMAIFGVPQFVPVIASSVSDEATRPMRTRPQPGVGESASATSFAADQLPRGNASRGEPQFQDLFSSPSRPRRDSRPIRDGESRGLDAKFVETSLSADNWWTQTSSEVAAAETTHNLNDLFGNSVVTANSTELRSQTRSETAKSQDDQLVARSKTTQLVSGSEKSNDGLTWREAVRRLNELGIQEFRLEPGSQLGEFYFACEFTPHRNARVTRRFEAEAKEPLLAVQSVLRQIDEWMTRR